MKKWIIIGATIGLIHFYFLAFEPIAQKLWVATFPPAAVILSLDQLFSPFTCQLIYIGLFIIDVAAFAGVGYCFALAIRTSMKE